MPTVIIRSEEQKRVKLVKGSTKNAASSAI